MPEVQVSKRERTRSSLLVAVQSVLLTSPPGTLSVPRITAAAGVSQGTFYNYFDSLDAALDGVGALLLTEHSRLVDQVVSGVEDPAVVFSHSTRLTLSLAASAKDYSRLLFDSGLPVDRLLGGLRARMAIDAARGQHSGRFRIENPEVVLSMASGSILGVGLDLYRGQLPPSAIDTTAEHLLRHLGLAARPAALISHLPLDVPAPRPLPIAAVAPELSDQVEVTS